MDRGCCEAALSAWTHLRGESTKTSWTNWRVAARVTGPQGLATFWSIISIALICIRRGQVAGWGTCEVLGVSRDKCGAA